MRQRLLWRAAAAWRADISFRLASGALATALVLALGQLVIRFVLPDRERLWAPDTLDQTVTAGLAFLALVAVAILVVATTREKSVALRRFRSNLVRWAGAVLVVLTFYAGYAAFRNQGRLSSEAALNDAGYNLYDLEMSDERIRCLYFNYGHDNPAACLEAIASNPKHWSTAIFYVEESWFQLTNARDERERWGASYADEIKYWAQDVSRDPTGVFAYYLVSSERNLKDVRATMVAADAIIMDVCGRYRIVWRALQRHGAQPKQVSGAARQCGRMQPIESSILQTALLPIPE